MDLLWTMWFVFLQDFEDWDDVGLNVPKPPDLLHLYRDFSQHTMPVSESMDFSCMTNIDTEATEKVGLLENLRNELVRWTAFLIASSVLDATSRWRLF